MKRLSLSASALVSTLFVASACSDTGTTNPVATPSAPSRLVAPGQSVGFSSDTTDAFGNVTLIQELPAGVYPDADGNFASVASVTIRSFIPASGAGTSKQACITSTIERTETTPGNTLTIKKSGGCNKDIEVQVEQKATKRKATFKFSMIPGKTLFDSGLLN